MTEAEVRKTKGFSLIELMIAMAILTIIATAAVPRVQVWNARNRGLQTVMELISDFSKARSVAGYTVAVNSDSGKIEIPVDIDHPDGDKMPVYMGVRRQTAMVFRKSEYGIYQKQSMNTASWDASALLLKKNALLDTVTVEKVNGSATQSDVSSFDEANTFNFTSTGKLKKFDGSIISSGAGSGKCGAGITERYLQNIVFSAVIRSKISKGGKDSIWYRVDIDQRGEYMVCTVVKESDSISDSDFDNDGVMLDV